MNYRYYLERLKAHERWVETGGRSGTRLDLSYHDLSGADFQRLNLRGACLQGVNLSDADLTGTDLRDADLQDVDFRNATLDGALLQRVNMRGATIDHNDVIVTTSESPRTYSAPTHFCILVGDILKVNHHVYIKDGSGTFIHQLSGKTIHEFDRDFWLAERHVILAMAELAN